MTPYVTTWSETQVLDYFWLAVRDDTDRILLLRQLATVKLERPSEWDRWFVRQAMSGVRLLITGDFCFVCRSSERKLYWHHVIAVAHGGSSQPRNLVRLCQSCHRNVHPWLDAPTTLENVHGWTKVSDLAKPVIEKIAAVLGAERQPRP